MDTTTTEAPAPLKVRKSRKRLEAPSAPTIPQDETFDIPKTEMPDPEAERARQQALSEQRRQRIHSIANEVSGMISAAVAAREASGVEQRWREDLTFYYGNEQIVRQIQGVINQALKDKVKSTNDGTGEKQTRSTISVNITRPKVNAAFARLSDMLLPVDDRNFAIEPTPVPQLSDDLTEQDKLVAGSDGTVVTAKQKFDADMQKARTSADAMQREIDDNLTECDYNSEARKLLFQATCLGTGVIRGPVAAMRTERSWSETDGEWRMRVVENVVPESRWVDLFNFYPDPACGGIIKNARYIVELGEYNARMLRDLRDQPGYITENIDRCLSQPPGSVRRPKSETQIVNGAYVAADQQMYEVCHVTCELTRGQLQDLGIKGLGGKRAVRNAQGDIVRWELLDCPEEKLQEAVGACVVMCNNMPIKAYLNPLKSGDLGYDVFCYEPVHGQPFGLGVAYLMRSPQRVLSTAWRMVMDNAALTIGGLVVLDKTCVEPADGNWDLYGGKVFYKVKGLAAAGKVEEAFKVFQMESHLDKLEKIIALAMKFAEDETSLPSLMEGNRGAAPDTVGGMTLLMNSANVVLKVLAKRYDDFVTKPHIGRYYEWHMLYSKKSEIKGDFNVLARGSTHLVVRDLARQSLIGFMQYAANPQWAPFFKDMGYQALRKVAEANHITPDDVLVSETEAPNVVKMIQENMARAAQAAQQKGQGGGDDGAKAQLEQQRLQMEMDDRKAQRDHELQIKQMDYQMKVMEWAEKRKISLDQARTELAKIVITGNQKDSLFNKEASIKAATGQGI